MRKVRWAIVATFGFHASACGNSDASGVLDSGMRAAHAGARDGSAESVPETAVQDASDEVAVRRPRPFSSDDAGDRRVQDQAPRSAALPDASASGEDDRPRRTDDGLRVDSGVPPTRADDPDRTLSEPANIEAGDAASVTARDASVRPRPPFDASPEEPSPGPDSGLTREVYLVCASIEALMQRNGCPEVDFISTCESSTSRAPDCNPQFVGWHQCLLENGAVIRCELDLEVAACARNAMAWRECSASGGR